MPQAKGTAAVEITVSHRKAKGTAYVDLAIAKPAKGSAALSIDVTEPVYKGTASLSISVRKPAKGTANIALNVIDSVATRWRAEVLLGGVDVSARCTGLVEITRAETSATVAEFAMLPDTGPIDVMAWVGQSVLISYLDINSSGGINWRERRFYGVVAEPTRNPDTGIVSFLCTNDLQGVMEALPKTVIDAVVGGRYSPHVFDENASHWDYARDRLSTRPAALHLDANGLLYSYDWAANATPDFTFTDTERLAGSTQITRADKSQLINTIDCNLDFRFERFKQRNVAYTFRFLGGICDYLKAQFPLPQKSMVQSAAEGAGWDLQGAIYFVDAWKAGSYDCGRSESGERDVRVWGYSSPEVLGGKQDPDMPLYCIGANFSLGRRWAQTVTEEYTLQVSAAQSITANGVRADQFDYGIEAEMTGERVAWEQDRGYRFAIAGSGNTTAGGSLAGMPAGATVLANGDWQYEATADERAGRTAMQEAQRCMLDKARAAILASHRENRVRFEVLYAPGIKLGKTTRLQTPYVTAQGVIAGLVDRLDIETGLPTLEIELALSRAGAVGVVSETPREPVAASAADPLTEYDSHHWLQYHIGGNTSSPPYNENWEGYITNYDWDATNVQPHTTDPNAPQTVMYPERFQVSTPEIEAADRQALSVQAAQSFAVDILNDELTEVE